MNPLKRLNAAMTYIEQCLPRQPDIEAAARLAVCSSSHFLRMFSFLAGMPLSEYLRRRRLSYAALRLQQGWARVIDLAFDCGYQSPEAFTRAFKAWHGTTPARIRAGNASARVFAPMTFQLTIKGGSNMDVRLTQKKDFNFVGFGRLITLQYEGVNAQIEPLWQQLAPHVDMLKALCDTEPRGILCASVRLADDMSEGSELMQYVGVATTKNPPPGFAVLAIEPATWAVFRVTGKFPEAVQQTWARIYAEWLPSSGYESTEGPELLWNESPDTAKVPYTSEIWVPVCRRDSMTGNNPGISDLRV